MTGIENAHQRAYAGLAGNVRLTFHRCLIFWSDMLIFFVGKRRKVPGNSSQTNLGSLQHNVNSFGSDRLGSDSACSIHIGERLCKLEQLFDKFVCRKNSTVGSSSESLRSPTLVGSSDNEYKFGLPVFPRDAQSISSIGDGIVSWLPCSLVSAILTGTAWCPNLDLSTFHTHTGGQAREHAAFKL